MTDAWHTPGCLFSVLSTRAAQAAQLMPRMGKVSCRFVFAIILLRIVFVDCAAKVQRMKEKTSVRCCKLVAKFHGISSKLSKSCLKNADLSVPPSPSRLQGLIISFPHEGNYFSSFIKYLILDFLFPIITLILVSILQTLRQINGSGT